MIKQHTCLSTTSTTQNAICLTYVLLKTIVKATLPVPLDGFKIVVVVVVTNAPPGVNNLLVSVRGLETGDAFV